MQISKTFARCFATAMNGQSAAKRKTSFLIRCGKDEVLANEMTQVARLGESGNPPYPASFFIDSINSSSRIINLTNRIRMGRFDKWSKG